MAYRIGVAGFAFGNIMLFSFPEYFAKAITSSWVSRGIFSYINFGLSFRYFSTAVFRS